MSALPPAIWAPFEAFYIQSMLFNSLSAVRSITKLHALFEKIPESPTDENLERLPTKQVLNELQNMVVQAAALSRYFWPVRKGHEARGEMLREAFLMDKTNPLFSRDLRNAIEHFDERLDKYVASGIVGYIFPEYVGPKPIDDDVPGHFFRAYFLDVGAFRLLDEEFLIPPLGDELLFIHEHLASMDKNGGRLQPAKRNV